MPEAGVSELHRADGAAVRGLGERDCGVPEVQHAMDEFQALTTSPFTAKMLIETDSSPTGIEFIACPNAGLPVRPVHANLSLLHLSGQLA